MLKILITSDTTTSFITNALQKQVDIEFPNHGIKIIDGNFNSWFQQIHDDNSDLKNHTPDYWIHFWSPRSLTDNPLIFDQVKAFFEKFRNEPPHVKLITTTFVADPSSSISFYDAFDLEDKAMALNNLLKDFASKNKSISLLNFQSFFSKYGTKDLCDLRYEALAHTYFSPNASKLVAHYFLRALKAHLKTPRKGLVLDLDNTLWGGILGEDGPQGIELGNEGLGLVFSRFQKLLLYLKNHGVLLTICSKNNEEEALKVFQDHPGMILKMEDISAYRINWNSKAENLKELAKELNLDLNSFVFFDDSSFERENIRQLLPEVLVIDVPEDPSGYLEVMNECHAFDSFVITEEDKLRTRQYQEEKQRKALQVSSLTIEDFYKSLELKGSLFFLTDKNFERAVQLINKTNQFNLTTKRYSETQLRELEKNESYEVLLLQLNDRMGENGITGLVIIKKSPDIWEIENLLLSCRIIGRTVEFGILRVIAERAKLLDVKKLQLHFIPSAKNQVSLEFLKKSNLKLIKDGPHQTWQLDIKDTNVTLPKDYVVMTIQK